jgi:hypothetical protein
MAFCARACEKKQSPRPGDAEWEAALFEFADRNPA